jgi:hypothetical protein
MGHIKEGLAVLGCSALLCAFMYFVTSFHRPPTNSLNKVGLITVSNNAAIDLWEYKSDNINCLISVHAYVQTQGSFTQVSCK